MNVKVYMNKGIKEVINEFPEVGTLLEELGIGCVTCSVGTCLLKDVIKVHGFPADQERIAMSKIGKIINPDEVIDIQDAQTVIEKKAPQVIKYSPPIKRLVEEHDMIKRLLAFIPPVIADIQKEGGIDIKVIEDCVYYIRNYADRFHHAKEEDILFKYTDESQDIIQVMYEDHKTGRNFVKSVEAGLKACAGDDVIKGLNGYRELLTQHIKKEDEILYPWIDRTLTTKLVGELLSSFSEADRSFGLDITEKFEIFLNGLDTKYRNLKEELK